MKKVIISTILMICTILTSFWGYAVEKEYFYEYSAEKEVLACAKQWLITNYSKFYYIKDIDAHIIKKVKELDKINYTISLSCMTKLKATSVNDLPFVHGINTELNRKKGISLSNIQAINDFIKRIDFSDEYNHLSVNVVITKDTINRNSELKLYYQDIMSTTLYPVSVLKLDSDEMFQRGRELVNNILFTNKSPMSYNNYNRINARNYAWQWTGTNVNSCYDDGYTCGIKQNRTLWNNNDYPYFSALKHNDCCDFVSQCMAAGGIPIEYGVWDRLNDSAYGWTWTYVPSLKEYMINKGYWDSSSFSIANAGNIIVWSDDSHIALITLNDTVSHRFTAHTSDVHNYIYYNNSYFNFYTIKTTP